MVRLFTEWSRGGRERHRRGCLLERENGSERVKRPTVLAPGLALSRAIVPQRASSVPSRSCQAERVDKPDQTTRAPVGFRRNVRQSQKLFFEVCAPFSQRQLAFFPPASADPNSPRL